MRDRLISSRFFDLVSGADPASHDPRARVSRSGGGKHTLRLQGGFPAGWCGRLSLGLSAAGVSIVRGFARRIGDSDWVAELQVLAEDAAADPASLDLLALATAPPPAGPPAPITLDSYYVDGSPESGAHVFLEARGPDRVGFLGSLLERLAALSLFPDQMSIETWNGHALDCFYLRSERPGGRLRAPEAARELSAMLDGLRAPERAMA